MNKAKKVVCILAVVVLLSATVFCVWGSAADSYSAVSVFPNMGYSECVNQLRNDTAFLNFVNQISVYTYHLFFYQDYNVDNRYSGYALCGIASNQPIKFLYNSGEVGVAVSADSLCLVLYSGLSNNHTVYQSPSLYTTRKLRYQQAEYYYFGQNETIPALTRTGTNLGQFLYFNGEFPTASATGWQYQEGTGIFLYNDFNDTKPITPKADSGITFDSEYGSVYSGQFIPAATPEGSTIGDIFATDDYKNSTLQDGESVYSWLETDDLPTMDLWTAYKQIFLNTDTLPDPIVFNLMGVDCTFLDPRWLTENGVLLRTLMQALVIFYFLEWLFDSILSLVGSARLIKKTYEMPEVGLDFGDLDLTDEAWDPDTFSPEELEIALDVEDSFDFYYDD